MAAIDYDAAATVLAEHFATVEAGALSDSPAIVIDGSVDYDLDRLFTSDTQAYREVLLGCLLARIQNKSFNIRQPYVNLSEYAFNGRTLDERVVNPFLHDKRVPSSRGCYLSVFRRSVTLEPRGGLRDVEGYESLLDILGRIESTSDDAYLGKLLDALLHRFIVLREESAVPLNRLQRFSLDQYRALIDCLLSSSSGGRFPLFIVVAALRAINLHFELGWTVSFQGINVADRASGAVGDVTVTNAAGVVALSAEITERRIDRARVVSTFNAKIGPAGVSDYIFFVTEPAADDARAQAYRYFAQGHEINFADITTWAGMILVTLSQAGRSIFNQEVLAMLDTPEVPKALKVAWNDCANRIVASAAPGAGE